MAGARRRPFAPCIARRSLYCTNSSNAKAGRVRRGLTAGPEVRLDRAGELDGQRIAMAVPGVAGRDTYPALADAILLDVVLLDALEADADVARKDRRVVIRAAGIG